MHRDELDGRMRICEYPEYLVSKRLSDACDTLEIEHYRPEPIRALQYPFCLRARNQVVVANSGQPHGYDGLGERVVVRTARKLIEYLLGRPRRIRANFHDHHRSGSHVARARFVENVVHVAGVVVEHEATRSDRESVEHARREENAFS